MESVGKTIVSIYRKEWAEEEEQPPAISNGSIRNERTKVNKQLKDKKLDWKYVNGLVEFAMATYDQATLIKRIGDMRQKYRDCKKELIKLQESQEVIITEKVNEIIETQYEEKMNEKKEEMEEETIVLKERVEVQSQMIQNLMRKNEKNFNKVEELQKRPTRESYDDLQNRYDEYVNTISLRRSESSSSLSSDDDSKIKKKYKKLKSKCDKLELENFKLKQKINNKDDSDSDSDTSSDEEVITEQI